MLERTKAALNKTIRDIKKIIFLFTLVGLLVNIALLVYSLIKGDGNTIVNCILLGITTAYALFYLITTNFGKELDGKKSLKKIGKKVFKWMKRLVKVYTIAVAIYGLFVGSNILSPLFILLTGGQILAVVLGLIFDLIIIIVERRAQLFIDGFMADTAWIWEGVRKVTNVSRFFHREALIPKPDNTPNKNQLLLEELAQKDAQDKEREEKIFHARLRVEKAEQDLAKAQEKGKERAIRRAEEYLKKMQEELAAAQAEPEPTNPKNS